MFKLESYITPILLSYVDKYIKNFRPEDSQVSLWGGDASFHNLDLRLDVLEKELQLPFSLISGHIHELLIHVPWTKLASEPINITINTIECVLKLRDTDNPVATTRKENKRTYRKEEIVAPPGYVQSLINKIVSNITINCNNLILKYVEEDIVVSVNIKLLTFESANENWKASFIELSPSQTVIRKLIKLSDLTVCLDKRNAAGKIEIYQEPVLYRCCVEMRLLQNYNCSNLEQPSTIRLDVYCNRMEFSMTEQQIPMLMRVINLLLALHQRQLKNNEIHLDEAASSSSSSSSTTDVEGGEMNTKSNNESWAGWAWNNLASTIFPSVDIAPDNDETNHQRRLLYQGRTFQFGIYIDHAIFTFKVSEYYTGDHRGYYCTGRKLKYLPLLCLQLNGCFSDTVLCDTEWCSSQMGIGEAVLIPQGCCCCCGISDNNDVEQQPASIYYLKTTRNYTDDDDKHKLESLFDSQPDFDYGGDQRQSFNISWDYYINKITEEIMLDKAPAFAVDYLYHLELPEDLSSEQLSELGSSDLEYSNLPEKSLCRIVIGPFTVQVCSGFVHRLHTLLEVMKCYDYAPYNNNSKVEPELHELHPPSEDDFDALSHSIPMRMYQVTFFKPSIHFHLMDHPKFVPSKGKLFRRLKKSSPLTKLINTAAPYVTLECDTIDVKVLAAMYPKRLVYTTCQLPDPPPAMLDACYNAIDFKLTGFCSKMIFKQQQQHKHNVTILLVPFNLSCDYKSVLFPKYWIHSNIIHEEITIDIENISVTGTKAKWMVIAHILQRLSTFDCGNDDDDDDDDDNSSSSSSSLFTTTLLQDASKDSGMVVLELYAEKLNWKQVSTISTIAYNVRVDSLKAFVLEPNVQETSEPNQVLIISGPEFTTEQLNPDENCALLTATIQYSKCAEKRTHPPPPPPLVLFQVNEMKICFDPLLFRWLLYSPKVLNSIRQGGLESMVIRSKAKSEMSSCSSVSTPPRRANTPHESIHSTSSDKEQQETLPPPPPPPPPPVNDNFYYKLLFNWYPIWTNFLLSGDIGSCTIYFPTESLSAIGSQGIQQAVDMSLKNERIAAPDIVVVTLPKCHVRSSTIIHRESFLNNSTPQIPISVPEYLWIEKKQSFPWTIEMWNLNGYTLQHGNKLYFLKSVSGSATIALSTKMKSKKQDIIIVDTTISLLNVCVHIDNTPIVVALSENQVHLLASILEGLLKITSQLQKSNEKKKAKCVTTNCNNKDVYPDVISEEEEEEETSTQQQDQDDDDEDEEEDEDEEVNNMKLSVWLQWTIPRLRIKLYAFDDTLRIKSETNRYQSVFKLIFDMEDIMSSLDLQSIYMKLKSKIVSASVQHFSRTSMEDNWTVVGGNLGNVMQRREDVTAKQQQQDDFGFLNVTITRAKCGHVHSRWGGGGFKKKKRLSEMKLIEDNQSFIRDSCQRFISEVIIMLQPTDLILAPATLKYFYFVLEPLLNVSTESKNKKTTCTTNLPLIYFDCNSLRILMVMSEHKSIHRLYDDVLVMEIDGVNLLPNAENPICRVPVRPDIYQYAAQMRILNVPGSEIEDRQYQLNVISLSINTGFWYEFEQLLRCCKGNTTGTMNENPALEWNNLECGRNSLVPNLNLLPIIQKFSVNVIIAPAVVYGANILVCGCSTEINFISDIDINVSLQQINLVSALLTECTVDFHSKRPTFEAEQLLINDVEQSNVAVDSGVDMNSESKETPSLSTRSLISEKRLLHSNVENDSIYCPVEVLITAGQITLSMYNITEKKKQQEDNAGYEASEEGSDDDDAVSVPKQIVEPLLFILFQQPNIFCSYVPYERKVHVSCFNICLKTNVPQYTYTTGTTTTTIIPTVNDYHINLLETKSGVPDPNTGIPPAFLTIKWTQTIGKYPTTLDLTFGRPIKLFYSLTQFNHLLYIKNQVLDNLVENIPQQSSTCSMMRFKTIRNAFWNIDSCRLKMAQIAFEFKTKLNSEMIMLVALSKLESLLLFTNRPERVMNTLSVVNLTISVKNDDVTRLLLNPWSFKLSSGLFWETWQTEQQTPRAQFTMESDCFILDLGPLQLQCIHNVLNEYRDFIATANNESNADEHIPEFDTTDQYYKDDLRAGAFQFVAASDHDELPLPYQVMFWSKTIVAMAWRYPQPRILTKVQVFPVPYRVDADNDQAVLCTLQYWSECHNAYKTYTRFKLSESEMSVLDLPVSVPQPAVAAVWRVVLETNNFVSPRALAACLRIDSYFNPILVPKLQFVLGLKSTCTVSLYNQFNRNVAMLMPEKLDAFKPDGLVPDDQCFLSYDIRDLSVFLAKWHSNVAIIDTSLIGECRILDYSTLIMQTVLHSFPLRVTFKMTEFIALNLTLKPIHLKWNTSIEHTLAVSSQVWSQYHHHDKSNSDQQQLPEMILITRYVICNDTNVKIRFGQTGTDEDILLPSRFLHLYCWRSVKNKRRIRIAIQQNDWIWSKPFAIDSSATSNTSQVLELISEKRCVNVIMTVKSLSATQKQIIFSGQLILCNMLTDNFEMKLISVVKSEEAELKRAQSYVIGGGGRKSTFLLDLERKQTLRLRFFNLESAWSGDIPLEENLKCSQPWLVKIPLQERGQFLSIWCRVVIENVVLGVPKILVMLWPLFMVRSNLPVPTKVQIETSALNVHLNTLIRGRGQVQQLYCPGTVDHSHTLAFQLDSSSNATELNPQVPLNYGLVDSKQFFKRLEKEDNIDGILECLKQFDLITWPYIPLNLDYTEWITDDQPLTHVQVRYKNACQYSSSLLVELIPSCLLLNTLGCPISLIMNRKELCQVPHYGVVTPPKFEENNTFNLAVGLGDFWHLSPLLQLATPDWSQSFYMPKINGLIPLEGHVQIPVKCDSFICIVSITSSVVINEMRLLHVTASHVITNYTKFQFRIASLILPNSGTIHTITDRNMIIDNNSFVLESSNGNNTGTPILQWYTINNNDVISDSIVDNSLHIIIALDNSNAISTPIRIDANGLQRKNISIYSENVNIPLVLIVQQQCKDQLYLSIHYDTHPQLLIENTCKRKLYCAEWDASNGRVIVENDSIQWICSVETGTKMYYTLPRVSDKFPNVNGNGNGGLLVFAIENNNEWSQPFSVYNFNEQYIRIPEFGDVKLSIKKIGYTVRITVDSVTEMEISAQDIRSRLLLQANDDSRPRQIVDKINLQKSCDQNVMITPSNARIDQHYNTNHINMRKLCMKTMLEDYYPSSSSSLWNSRLNIAVLINSFVFTLTVEDRFEQTPVMTLICDQIDVTFQKNTTKMLCSISVRNIQCDNPLFKKESYDFPVVFVGEKDNYCSVLKVDLQLETWHNHIMHKQITEIQDVKITIAPIFAYIEDTYIMKLMDNINDLLPSRLVMWPKTANNQRRQRHFNTIQLPEHIAWEARMLAQPVTLTSLSIEPVSLLLSVHSSMKLYIALDRSPLQFARFECKNLVTTHYRLGHALTMHYLSGAIFGAGWVVGSLELLGNPSGLARNLGSGLRDFITLPYYGFIEGPWAFLIGITHGSASLMRHVTAGTLDSVTKLAASVARNLDRLTLDEEHQRRTEESRRKRPQGLTEGFVQGLTGLGISLLGAVGGIAHHPLQSILNEGGATTRGLAVGVGVGLVGVITKPLSGAAELVALTGQGLLQGAGWNLLPDTFLIPIESNEERALNSSNNNNNNNHYCTSAVKYKWKFLLHNLTGANLFAITEAVLEASRVVLVLTFDALVVLNLDEDDLMVQHVLRMDEIAKIEYCTGGVLQVTLQNVLVESEMDQVSRARARVVDYVRNTGGGGGGSISPPLDSPTTTHSVLVPRFLFYMNSVVNQQYFYDFFQLVKQQNQSSNTTFRII